MKLLHKPYKKFKGWLKANDLTYKDISKLLNLSVQTVSAKINGQSDFLLSEILKLKETYNLNDDIFFEENV